MFFDDNIGFFALSTDFSDNLFDSYEGFIHGNMFKNEYKDYKNYKMITPKAKNEQESYLFKIMELEFAINDLGLYLDLHDDDIIYGKFKIYVEELLALQSEYVKKYGSLEICESIDTYNWISDMPWEREDGKYV